MFRRKYRKPRITIHPTETQWGVYVGSHLHSAHDDFSAAQNIAREL